MTLRNLKLFTLGNGCVPAQAEDAFEELLQESGLLAEAPEKGGAK